MIPRKISDHVILWREDITRYSSLLNTQYNPDHKIQKELLNKEITKSSEKKRNEESKCLLDDEDEISLTTQDSEIRI